MSPWLIYLFTRCEPLREAAKNCQGFGMFMLCLLGVLGSIIWGAGNDLIDGFDSAIFKKYAMRLFTVIVILLSVSTGITVITPSRADIAVILAGTWATNNDEMKRLPDNVVGTINKFLDDYRKEKP